ncbi:MAG: recombinase family protein [Synergistaceae bacterium]|nr:recombinase family protein [Synergistaceae bacterium]
MKNYGYCRVSTPKQNIERQIRNILKEFPDAIIVQESFTGAIFQGRKELEKLLRIIQAGDTIIFDSVSRMSRNADEGFTLYEQLYNKGVNLVFLKETHINTDTYRKTLQEKKIFLNLDSDDEATDKLMKSILEALNDYVMALAKKQIQLAFVQSQKEIDDLHQRTREGIDTARRNGKQIGQKQGNTLHIRKKSPIQQLILKYSKSFNGSNSDREVIAIINASPNPDDKSKKLCVSINTYYKYKREMRERELCV